MLKKYYRVAIGMLLAVFMVFGGAISPLSGAFDVFAADNGKWIYIDGQSGNDGNDGSSATSAVKSWDKAKELLGCEEGGIYVVGTVDASGEISTKNPTVQTVKRNSDIVMFNVNGEATFANIDVDGEDKHYDKEVVKPNNGARVNYLTGAVFHNIGYNPGAKKAPRDYVGGLVSSLDQNVKILIDGAEFRDNKGVGIFYRPLPATSVGGVTPVTLEMKSGKVTGNRGYFYHNEANAPTSNLVYVYNALIKNNNASSIPQQYTDYGNRTGVVYICDIGIMQLRSVDGAAIYDNKSYDLMHLDAFGAEKIRFLGEEGQGDKNHKMLGGGSANWSSPIDAGNKYWGFKSNPSDADKALAEKSATSIFTDNGPIIDSNGKVQFGLFNFEKPQLETPPVTPVQQGCDDTPTEPEKTPVITNTTAKLADNSASDKEPAKYELSADDKEGVVLSDTVEFKDLNSTKTYTVRATAYDADGKQVRQKSETVSGKTEGAVTISFDSKMSEGTYKIKAELLLDGKVVASHNDKFDTISECAIVTRAEPEGSLKTTVTAKNITASSSTEAKIQVAEAGEEVDVKDNIDYENLTAGATYTVTGALMEVADNGSISQVAVATEEKVATAASGSWEITFRGVRLEPNKKYVVFESAVNKNDDNDKAEHKDPTDKSQTVVTEPETPKEPTKGKLATTVNGSNGSQAAELVAGADGKIITDVTDKIDYSGLKGGATYTVSGTLIEKESGDAVATASKNDCVADESGNGSWEITFKDVTLEAGKTYVVYEEAVNNADDKDKAEHKDKEDPAQTLVVKTPEEPTPPVEDDGHLKTTVTVDGKKASSEAAVQTKAGNKDVTDTIDYEGLEKGATYKVNGTLYNVTDGKDVATASEEKEAEDTKGSWTITFKGVNLEAGKTYVVFEEATLIKDAEGNDVTNGTTHVHKDVNDKAQTVVVEKQEEEVPPTPDKPDTPVNPSTNDIKVTTEVKNQYISPAKNQSIVDIVKCTGLESGKTYTLKGVIMNKATGKEVPSSNYPCEITSNIDAAEMTFSEVDCSGLKDGDQLVVFEYLYEGDEKATENFKPGDGKEIASHADLTDVAQTSTVKDGQIKISKKADVQTAESGEDVPYTITVTNERKVPAVVNVIDTPDDGLVFVEADNEGEYDESDGTVVWSRLEVPAESSISVNATFTISEDASGKLKNKAKVYEPDNQHNVLGTYEDDDDVKVLGVYDEDDTDSDNSKKSTKVKGTDTGDDSPIALSIIGVLGAAVALEIMRRRRMN